MGVYSLHRTSDQLLQNLRQTCGILRIDEVRRRDTARRPRHAITVAIVDHCHAGRRCLLEPVLRVVSGMIEL